MGHASDAVEHAQNGLIAFPGHPALLDILSGVGSSPPVVALQTEPVVETPSATEIEEPRIEAPISEPVVESSPEPEIQLVPEPEVQPEPEPEQNGYSGRQYQVSWYGTKSHN